MAEHTSWAERLEALRSSFDEGFARAPAAPVETRDLLILSAGGERYALPLDGLAAVESAPPVTPLRSSHPALIGLANRRGRIVPVFSLARLLGQTVSLSPEVSPLAGSASPPCEMFALIVLEGAEKVYVGFEHLIELTRVERPPADDPTASRVYRTADGVIPVLDLSELKTRVIARHEET